MKKVSIIMPVYNMQRFIGQAIESVIVQSFLDYELIIVDDGSVDGSKTIIDGFIDKYGATVSILYHYQQNQGLACARNTAINISIGEFIALLDPDDIWTSDRLQKGVDILDRYSDVGLVHANIVFIDEHGAQVGVPQRNAPILSGDLFETLLFRKGNISCPTVLFRRECLEKAGLFDENLTYLGCEDRDLWLRISRHYKIKYIEKELAYYRRVTGSMSSNSEKMFQARTYVVDKNAKGLFRRKGYAAIYKEMADNHAYQLEYRRAINNYLISLSYWPFNLKAMLGTAKTALKYLLR